MRKVQGKVQDFTLLHLFTLVYFSPPCSFVSWCVFLCPELVITETFLYFSGLWWAVCRTSPSWEHGWRTLWYRTMVWRRRSGKWQRNRFVFSFHSIYLQNNNLFPKSRSFLMCGFYWLFLFRGSLRLSDDELQHQIPNCSSSYITQIRSFEIYKCKEQVFSPVL